MQFVVLTVLLASLLPPLGCFVIPVAIVVVIVADFVDLGDVAVAGGVVVGITIDAIVVVVVVSSIESDIKATPEAVNDALFCKLPLLFSNGDVFAPYNNDALGLWVRLAQRLCLVSTFTCTKTPGRNGHFGGLFGISGGGGRGGGGSTTVVVVVVGRSPAVVTPELLVVVCVDNTLILRVHIHR